MIPRLEIFGFSLYTFGLFVALGIIVGTIVADRFAETRGITVKPWLTMFWVSAIAGVGGSRLGYVIVNFSDYTDDPLDIFRIWEGGMAWYGGFIGTLASIIWYVRRRGWDIRQVLDSAAIGLPVGYAVGRIGCFLNGDDYGGPSGLPWAVSFARGTPTTFLADFCQSYGEEFTQYCGLNADLTNLSGVVGVRAVPENYITGGLSEDVLLQVQPTQIYEIIAGLAICAFLWFFMRTRVRRPGDLFAWFLVLGGAERFLVEFPRVVPEIFGPLSGPALLGLAEIAAGVVWLVLSSRREAIPLTSGVETFRELERAKPTEISWDDDEDDERDDAVEAGFEPSDQAPDDDLATDDELAAAAPDIDQLDDEGAGFDAAQTHDADIVLDPAATGDGRSGDTEGGKASVASLPDDPDGGSDSARPAPTTERSSRRSSSRRGAGRKPASPRPEGEATAVLDTVETGDEGDPVPLEEEGSVPDTDPRDEQADALDLDEDTDEEPVVAPTAPTSQPAEFVDLPENVPGSDDDAPTRPA